MIHTSHKHKFIFIHNPKVAGMSINACLKNSVDDYDPKGFSYIYKDGHINHAAVEHFQTIIPNNIWESYTKFVFVRNPYDKFISGWKYAQKTEKIVIDFTYFVNNLDEFKKYPSILWHTIISQSTHLDDSCTMLMGKYECLNDDLSAISKILNIKLVELPKLNTTKHENYKLYYNENLANIIYNRFRKDFVQFNYERDSWK